MNFCRDCTNHWCVALHNNWPPTKKIVWGDQRSIDDSKNWHQNLVKLDVGAKHHESCCHIKFEEKQSKESFFLMQHGDMMEHHMRSSDGVGFLIHLDPHVHQDNGGCDPNYQGIDDDNNVDKQLILFTVKNWPSWKMTETRTVFPDALDLVFSISAIFI